jgi:hypothetical protein
VPVTRSITESAALADTSTIECDSRMSMRPTSPLSTPPSFTIAPSKSAARALSRVPTLTKRRTMGAVGA